MAERRMFAKSVISSDSFLDMPASAQLLYFHLSLMADDDGFINNPRRIQRMVGCSVDDLESLIEKRFLISFESGVVVIRHWRMNNQIRCDRYKPSIFPEKSLIVLDEGMVYELSSECQSVGIPLVYQMDTQYSIGQDRSVQDSSVQDSSGQDRAGEDRSAEVTKNADVPSVPPAEELSVEDIVGMYHEICKSYPRVTAMSKSRSRAVKARMRTYTAEQFRTVFGKAENSAFLRGDNQRKWSADFDWMMKESNFVKILDGNYDETVNRSMTAPAPKNSDGFDAEKYYQFVNMV